METSGDRPIDAEQAREALARAEADEDAVRRPVMPSWFFPVVAVLLAGMAASRLLPEPDPAFTGLGVAVVLLALRYWVNRDGVRWSSYRFGDVLPTLSVLLGTMALAWLAEEVAGATWAWAVAAVVVGGVALGAGQRYQRSARAGA